VTWPAFVLASALAYAWAFTTREPELAVVFAIPAVQIALLFALELRLAAEPRSAARFDPGLGNDLAHIALGNGLGGPLSEIAVPGARRARGRPAGRRGRGRPLAAELALRGAGRARDRARRRARRAPPPRLPRPPLPPGFWAQVLAPFGAPGPRST
jgi:hypothetical protein